MELFEDEASRARLGRCAPRAGADGAARRHFPGPQGFPLRRLPGAADVSRAVGARGSPRCCEPGRTEAAAELGAAGSASFTSCPRPSPSSSIPTCTRRASAPGGSEPAPISPGGCSCAMAPALPGAAAAWVPGSVLLPEQGLAILRTAIATPSLECGVYGGGHGHPDRLHLTLHADGVHWLADPGTGSYVSPRPLLVSLHAGPQRAAGRWAVPADGRCPRRDVRRAARLGLGPRPLRRTHPDRGGRPGAAGGRGRVRRRGRPPGRAPLAPRRRGGDRSRRAGGSRRSWTTSSSPAA